MILHIRKAVGAIFIALLTLSTHAAENAAGTWKWAFSAQNGESIESIMVLKQDGEKLTGFEDGDYRFFTLSRYDGELDLALLKIEHGIRRRPLREDDLPLAALDDRPSRAGFGEEGVRVEAQAFLPLQLRLRAAHVKPFPDARVEFPGEDAPVGRRHAEPPGSLLREEASRARFPPHPQGPSHDDTSFAP